MSHFKILILLGLLYPTCSIVAQERLSLRNIWSPESEVVFDNTVSWKSESTTAIQNLDAVPGQSTDLSASSLIEPSETYFTRFPTTKLWKYPLANQREPRFSVKFGNAEDQNTIDTAIGGVFGLGRLTWFEEPQVAVQVDLFAVAFTRFDASRLLKTADYRVGIPITAAWGPWQSKFSYEHTSTHLGDEFIERTGRLQREHVRDELVWGLARQWEQVRVYGQFGYSFATGLFVGNNRDRYNFGIEWLSRNEFVWGGRWYANADFDFRSDQDLATNFTLQLGWSWTENDRTGRLGVEYYDGQSPYGQFFDEDESWWAFGMYFDY